MDQPDHLRRKGRRESHVDCRYRGVFAIQAGQRFDRDLQPWQRSIVARIDDVPRGAIIGVVELMDVVRDSSSRWAEPRCYHWVLSEPRTILSVPMRGRLGLWAPEVDSPRSRRLVARNSSLVTGACCAAHPPARREGRHSDSAGVHDGDSDRAGLTGVLQ